jgi:hypothetical protein
VTNDGIPEALVEYCHMGAYTSQVALLRLEHGKPVLAQFRGKAERSSHLDFWTGLPCGMASQQGSFPRDTPSMPVTVIPTILEDWRHVPSMPMSGSRRVRHLTRTKRSAKR